MCNVLPVSVSPYRVDGRPTDAKLGCQCDRYGIGVGFLTDGFDTGGGQQSHAVGSTTGLSSLRYLVNHIVCLGAEEQVVRIDALGVVAVVADKEAIGDWPIGNFICHAMGWHITAIVPEHSMSECLSPPKPGNAPSRKLVTALVKKPARHWGGTSNCSTLAGTVFASMATIGVMVVSHLEWCAAVMADKVNHLAWHGRTPSQCDGAWGADGYCHRHPALYAKGANGATPFRSCTVEVDFPLAA